MSYPVIIRNHDGFQSYLVLDDHPRELLRHWGFQDEFEVRCWRGSTDPVDAAEEWCEMLGEEMENYLVTDDTHRDYVLGCHLWDKCQVK